MSTIRSSREIDQVFRSAQRSGHPLVAVIVAPTPQGRDPMGRVAFIAGKKLGGAVVRNRAKRVLRAAARTAGGPWAGLDVLLIARSATGHSRSDDVARAIIKMLTKVQVIA